MQSSSRLPMLSVSLKAVWSVESFYSSLMGFRQAENGEKLKARTNLFSRYRTETLATLGYTLASS